MASFQIKKGKDIRIKGAAQAQVDHLGVSKLVGLYPLEFYGLKPRVLVKPGAAVKVGDPVIQDKNHPEIVVVSPASGVVKAVNRGDKRVLINVVIESDGAQTAVAHAPLDPKAVSREDLVTRLIEGGVWPSLRQRPFSKIAGSHDVPKSIFVQAMSTEPLALNVDVALEGAEERFQTGLNLLTKLTNGAVHLCYAPDAKSKALTNAQNVQKHTFGGVHPAGNVSTHIHHVDPINKGELVWFIEAQDVLRVADIVTKGVFNPDLFVVVTGEGVAESKRRVVKTTIGSSIAQLLSGTANDALRYLSGSVLTGFDAGFDGFVRYYHRQVHVLPNKPERKMLRFALPGFGEYSESRTFVGTWTGASNGEVSLDTDTNGSDRAIVANDIYDRYVPLEVYTYFLLKAILVGDWDEAERLGILECEEEDFALCSFVCPSKTNVGAIVRKGLEAIDREG